MGKVKRKKNMCEICPKISSCQLGLEIKQYATALEYSAIYSDVFVPIDMAELMGLLEMRDAVGCRVEPVVGETVVASSGIMGKKIGEYKAVGDVAWCLVDGEMRLKRDCKPLWA